MEGFPDWFTHTIPNFEVCLAHLAGTPKARVLQIGAFTGDASHWLAENILTGEGALLEDVDTWEGSKEEEDHEQLDWVDLHQRYRERMTGRPVISWRMTSDAFFDLTKPSGLYDFIYVDGDHWAEQVGRDAQNADLALKPGGVLAFDDYNWFFHPQGQNPRDAIDRFMAEHDGRYGVLAVNSQVWLQKSWDAS